MVVESYTKGSIDKMKEQGRRFRYFMIMTALIGLLMLVLTKKKPGDSEINKELNQTPNQEQVDTTQAKDTIIATQYKMDGNKINNETAKSVYKILQQCKADTETAAIYSNKKTITKEDRVKTLQLVISIKGNLEQVKDIIPIDYQLEKLLTIQKDLYKIVQA